MLARLIPPLTLLLGLVGLGDAQYGNCDYLQIIEPGKVYPLFSPNYPRNVTPGTWCRWTARSDRPIRLSCDVFEIPQTNKCVVDVVIIQTGLGPGQRYCGVGKLRPLVSEGNEIILSLQSSRLLLRRRFFCTVQTVDESKDNCNCGWKNPTRIVGGTETGVNEYPMMAGIVDPINKIVACGATIINDRQVLTAAHCIKSFENPMIMGVLVGDHDIIKREDTNATQLFKVATYVVHENYSPTTKDNDIGIVTIDGVIRISQQVGPACLPFQHASDTFAGSYVDILGWGSTRFGAIQSNVLQKAEVTVLTPKMCQRSWPSSSNKQICTLEPGKDACQFDSGGPLLWRNPTTKRMVLVGIIAYGSVCADVTPGVNTRIGTYMNWIMAKSLKNYQYCEEE